MTSKPATKAVPDSVEGAIRSLARQCGIRRVILFGSRARGDNHERSDIDLAVSGGNVAEFTCDIDYETPTLLMFDVVNLDKPVSQALRDRLERDGVVLYEE